MAGKGRMDETENKAGQLLWPSDMGRRTSHMGAGEKRKYTPEHRGSGKDKEVLQDEQTGQIYPVNNVFVSIINNAMVEEDKGEYTVTEPLFNPLRGILWKNNVCKLRAHFRTDDKNIKVLKSLKGVDITPEVPEE